MFALVQACVVWVGYSMTGAFAASDLANVDFLVLTFILSFNPGETTQRLGIIAAWGLVLASMGIRWLAVS